VFDERVSVGHDLKPGHLELCRSCRDPITAEDKLSPLYEDGVTCPACHGSKTEAQLAGFRQRQKQIALAKQRNQRHIGVRREPKVKPQIDAKASGEKR
jgi:UPF0176 protein